MSEKIVTMKDSSLHTIIAVAQGKEVKSADWVEDAEKMDTLPGYLQRLYLRTRGFSMAMSYMYLNKNIDNKHIILYF